jgi:regulator of protease activity HflC (stomatin/prohibitin superfamily)
MIWHLMTKLTVKDGERALLTRNGRLERVLEPGRHRLFDPRNELTVEVLNVLRTEFSAERHAVLKAARPDLAS